MEKEVTMSQVIGFESIFNTFNNKSLPLPCSYKLIMIRRSLEKDYNFYSENFNAIVNSYALKDADGNLKYSDDNEQILINPAEIDECNRDLNDLLTLPVPIENYGLTVKDFGDIDCTPEELENLFPFFDDEVDPAPTTEE